MDKSLLTILLLSPGMVGIATSALFNGESNPPEIGKAVIKYFLYSCFAWILSELILSNYNFIFIRCRLGIIYRKAINKGR